MTAKWLGCTPWELAAQPSDWLAAAQTMMDAENGAAAERQNRADRQARMRGMRGA